jgi:hypothetical protein
MYTFFQESGNCLIPCKLWFNKINYSEHVLGDTDRASMVLEEKLVEPDGGVMMEQLYFLYPKNIHRQD